MLFPKPVIEKKTPKRIPQKRVRESPSIDYSNMPFSKPVVSKKQPAAIKTRRKPNKNETINSNFCFFCGSPYALEKHHIFFGTEHDLSEKYGVKVLLCHDCHRGSPNGVHHNRIKDLELKVFGQTWFTKFYSELDFFEIFGCNYL